MIITNFPYVSVLPWKILPSHRLKNLTIVLVETSLALGTTSCINTTRTNSTTVYTIWGFYGTSEKVRQLPTFFCCHCFFDVPSKMPVVLLMIMNIFREEKKVVLNADLRCKCFWSLACMGIKAFKAPLMNMILCTECAIKLSQNTKGAHKEFVSGTCPHQQ